MATLLRNQSAQQKLALEEIERVLAEADAKCKANATGALSHSQTLGYVEAAIEVALKIARSVKS